MKFSFRKLAAIAFLIVIALASPNLTLASTDGGTAKQAAQEVLKDTGAKQVYGKGESGDVLIDKAKNKASKKLDDLGESADKSDDLPQSKKLFLKNLESDS